MVIIILILEKQHCKMFLLNAWYIYPYIAR